MHDWIDAMKMWKGTKDDMRHNRRIRKLGRRAKRLGVAEFELFIKDLLKWGVKWRTDGTD